MYELHHGAPNAYHLKPLILLHEKSIPFHAVPRQAGARPWAGTTEIVHNLEGEGPVLVVDGQAMSDALFINLYLDETSAAPQLRPATPEGHWQLLMWGRFVGEVLAPAIHSLGRGAEGELLQACHRKAGLAAQKIEAALDPGPWLLGAGYSLADIEVYGHARSIPLLCPGCAGPRLLAWIARMDARPAVQAALGTGGTPGAADIFPPGPEHSRWG